MTREKGFKMEGLEMVIESRRDHFGGNMAGVPS